MTDRFLIQRKTGTGHVPVPGARREAGLRRCACGGAAGLDGECAQCRAKRLAQQRDAGRPIDDATRTQMETLFGRDFGGVRVHTGPEAAAAAESVDAAAFTLGRNIVFGAGRYEPHTNRGRRLVAHELVHVIQQRRGGSDASGAAEREADRAARLVTGSSAGPVPIALGARGVQRQPASPSAEPAAVSERDSILATAERARKQQDDKTEMFFRAVSIGYRLISLAMPEYSDRLSGVGYDERLAGVRADVKGRSIDVRVGKGFVLTLNEKTFDQHVSEFRTELAAKAPFVRPAPAGAAKTVEVAPAPTPTPTAEEKRKPEPAPSAQDAAAIEGLKKVRCQTEKDGFEHCGLVIKTGKGTYRITSPVTQRSQFDCEASAPADQNVVAYYHSHPEGQGDDFSQASARRPVGDRDESEHKKWDWYLVNSKGGMKRYIPSRDERGRGPTLDIGTAPECP
jgi:proteasome lid subunit RPN8/RPN11